MSQYTRKKNIKNFGVLRCPPLYPTPSPWETATFSYGPSPDHFIPVVSFTLSLSTSDRIHYVSHPTSTHPHILSSCHVILSDLVMSLCHVYLSCHLVIHIYTYQLQTKYDTIWIIYTNQITNNNYEKRTNKNSNHVGNVLQLHRNIFNNYRNDS